MSILNYIFIIIFIASFIINIIFMFRYDKIFYHYNLYYGGWWKMSAVEVCKLCDSMVYVCLVVGIVELLMYLCVIRRLVNNESKSDMIFVKVFCFTVFMLFTALIIEEYVVDFRIKRYKYPVDMLKQWE